MSEIWRIPVVLRSLVFHDHAHLWALAFLQGCREPELLEQVIRPTPQTCLLPLQVMPPHMSLCPLPTHIPPRYHCTHSLCRCLHAPIILLLLQPLCFSKTCVSSQYFQLNLDHSYSTKYLLFGADTYFHLPLLSGIQELCQFMPPVIPGGSLVPHEMGQSLRQQLLPVPCQKLTKL